MILLSFGCLYLVICFVSSLVKTQDEKHKKRVEEQKRQDELYKALKNYGTGKY